MIKIKFKNVSLKELDRRFKLEKDRKVKERIHILLLLKEKYTQLEISDILHISTGKVPFWKARFEKEGFKGLLDKTGRGRKSVIADEQLRKLKLALSKPITMVNGYTRGWQTKDVSLFIRQKYGLSYTSRNIRKIVSKFGLVRLVPRPRNMRRNQESVDDFKKSSS
ncbi:MAG: winged helix-turn-helix domain-containing protein [Candidatus Cloacimonadota bacterium]|nr:winged helix-turn-helix domain-containing protein [Candidatus Cloacimonadota bacterium]